MVATAAAIIGWLIVERLRDGHPTSLGAASGAVAGLVAVTPACAFIAPWAAIVLGLLAGAVCALAVGHEVPPRLRRLARRRRRPPVRWHRRLPVHRLLRHDRGQRLGRDGLFYGGGSSLLGKQALGAVTVLAYSFVITAIIGYVIKTTIGFRMPEDEEVSGIDLAEHAETAYDFTSIGTGSRPQHAAIPRWHHRSRRERPTRRPSPRTSPRPPRGV